MDTVFFWIEISIWATIEKSSKLKKEEGRHTEYSELACKISNASWIHCGILHW